MAGFKSLSGKHPLAGLVRLEATVHAAKLKAVVGVALILVGAIKLELSKPGTGRIYKRARQTKTGQIKKGKSGKTLYIRHQASAPGEPPAVDTGVLRNSINFEIQQFGKVVVGTGNEYAEPLEFGADLKRGGKIEPRPFMRPALENVRDAMGNSIVGDLRSAVRK